MLEEELLEIYVDGSVRNEKAGIVGRTREINSNGEEIFKDLFSKEIFNVKSSEAEILACAYALEAADRLGRVLGKKQVIVYSDFRVLVDGYRSMAHWVGSGISAKTGKSVIHRQHWKKIAKQRENYYQKYQIRVEVKKVAAHRNNLYNNSVDIMARTLARQPSYSYPKPTSILSPKNKSDLPKPKKRASEIMELVGQEVRIKILDYEYWEKKNWIYKYEFFSPRRKSWCLSEHKISSRLSLDRGKTYLVKVNKDKHRPYILEAREVEL